MEHLEFFLQFFLEILIVSRNNWNFYWAAGRWLKYVDKSSFACNNINMLLMILCSRNYRWKTDFRGFPLISSIFSLTLFIWSFVCLDHKIHSRFKIPIKAPQSPRQRRMNQYSNFSKSSYVIHWYVNLCADSKLTSEPFDSKFQPIHNFTLKKRNLCYLCLFILWQSQRQRKIWLICMLMCADKRWCLI